LRAGSANDGDESVNADAGADDAAIIIVAPARAAVRLPGMRCERMFLSKLPPRDKNAGGLNLGGTLREFFWAMRGHPPVPKDPRRPDYSKNMFMARPQVLMNVGLHVFISLSARLIGEPEDRG
jgi:hypothetical protein